MSQDSSQDDERDAVKLPIVTIPIRSILRVASFLAGCVSVGYGLFVVNAVYVASTTQIQTGNPYYNYIFDMVAMLLATLVGVFALVLALLGR